MKNNLYMILRVFAFAMLAVVAIPGLAASPQKTFSVLIEHDPVADPVVPPVLTTLWIKNESPPPNTANSNIGSFRVTLGGLTIVATTPITLSQCPTITTCAPDTGATVTAGPDTITVTNISPPIQQQGFYKVTFGVSSCGDGAVTAHVFSGSQVNGAEFAGPKSDSDFFNGGSTGPHVQSSTTTQILCGSVACSTTAATPFSVPVNDGAFSCTYPSSEPECVAGVRSGNKDGFCSAKVDYAVTNTLGLADNKVHVEWFTEPAAVFAYKVNFLKNNTPNLAWMTVNNQPYFIPGDTCIGYPSTVASSTAAPTDLLPNALTTLAADVAVSDKKISVSSTSGLPATTPFDIVVGPYQTGTTVTIERMRVTKVNSANGTLNVTRGVGGTSASAHPAIVGTTATPVMSTPMKTLASNIGPYAKDDQEQMCIAQGPIDNGDGTFYFWLIDIGDGWGTQP
jgi:hypothetical protein